MRGTQGDALVVCVALNKLVDLNKLAGETPSLF